MSLTATYAGDLSRVRLVVASAPSFADYSKIERSTDQITWVTVRGGDTVALTSGGGSLDDYEFTPGVPNYYRASHVDSADITFVAQGTHATGNNTSVTPGLPAGLAAGDTMLLFAATSTGAVNTPAGWTLEAAYGPMVVFSRRYVTSDVAPSVTFTGGTTGTPTSAFIAAWRNLQPGYVQVNGTINASAQDILVAPLSTIGTKRELIAFEWKQNGAATAGSTLTPFGGTVTLANATGQTLFYSRVSATSNVQSFPQQTMTVTGGVAAISRSLVFAYRRADYVTQETATLTPVIDKVWIKNVQRPYMNTALTLPVGELKITRKSRAGIFPVISRSLPVAVTDLRLGKEYSIGARVEDSSERDRLDLILNAGEPILLHVPPGTIRLTSMYAVIGDSGYDDETLTFTLPLTQVAAPSSTIVGATVLYSDIVSTFATYADLLAAEPTYSDVLDRIGSPTDIVTG